MLRVIDPVLRPVLRSVIGARRGGGVPLPAPTTINIPSAQFAAGFSGSISTTKNAARIYGRGLRTLWAGFISGSEAVLQATSEMGSIAGLVQCSINGGNFVDCPNTASAYTLFTGSDSLPKFVQVRFNWDWNDTSYIASSGNVLSVTGQPPSLTAISDWVSAGSLSSTGFYNAATVPNIANFTPALQATKNTTIGSNVGSVKIRGAFTELYVAGTGNPHRIGVSKNGAAPVFYSVTDAASPEVKGIRVPCDGSLSTYYVWDSGTGFSNGGVLSVAGNAPRQDVGLRARMDQFGDSITFGSGPGAVPSDVETMWVAAQLGFTGSTNGQSGHTIAQLKTLLDAVLPMRTVTSSDVAIIAIGRNNAGSLDAAAQADYLECIDKLLAKGYGKVLCRGILPPPNGSTLWPTENAALQSVVTAKANQNVIWIPTNTWLGYSSADNTHPTAAGYVTLAGYAVPAYSAVL